MLVGSRCLLACLLLAPLASGSEVSRVALGLVAPPSEGDATSLQRGAQLAVAEANDGGQPPVRLDVRSEDGQWGTAGNDAVTLVSERHVDAIIAPSDGATNHLILQVSGRTQVPVASVCSDTSVTNMGVPWVVRVVPRADQEAQALFAAARRPDHSPLHWWAVVPPGRSGSAIRRDLAKAAQVSSIPLDQIVEDGAPRTDRSALVNAIAAAAPGGVLIWLTPARAGTLAAKMRAAGYGGRLAGPSPLDSSAFISAAGAAATAFLVTAFRADARSCANADAFARQFRRSYGADPDFSAAAAYDAARVLIGALRRAEPGAGDRQFPLALPTPGATGVLHFDQSGNRIDALQVLTCQQGRFIPIPSIDQKP